MGRGFEHRGIEHLPSQNNPSTALLNDSRYLGGGRFLCMESFCYSSWVVTTCQAVLTRHVRTSSSCRAEWVRLCRTRQARFALLLVVHARWLPIGSRRTIGRRMKRSRHAAAVQERCSKFQSKLKLRHCGAAECYTTRLGTSVEHRLHMCHTRSFLLVRAITSITVVRVARVCVHLAVHGNTVCHRRDG